VGDTSLIATVTLCSFRDGCACTGGATTTRATMTPAPAIMCPPTRRTDPPLPTLPAPPPPPPPPSRTRSQPLSPPRPPPAGRSHQAAVVGVGELLGNLRERHPRDLGDLVVLVGELTPDGA